jgi:hypothetical protein
VPPPSGRALLAHRRRRVLRKQIALADVPPQQRHRLVPRRCKDVERNKRRGRLRVLLGELSVQSRNRGPNTRNAISRKLGCELRLLRRGVTLTQSRPIITQTARAHFGTNAGTNGYRIATARNDQKVGSGNDRKALESCAFNDPSVAIVAISVSLAVKRFVGSSPITSTRPKARIMMPGEPVEVPLPPKL